MQLPCGDVGCEEFMSFFAIEALLNRRGIERRGIWQNCNIVGQK
jgi:hypothetical protein